MEVERNLLRIKKRLILSGVKRVIYESVSVKNCAVGVGYRSRHKPQSCADQPFLQEQAETAMY